LNQYRYIPGSPGTKEQIRISVNDLTASSTDLLTLSVAPNSAPDVAVSEIEFDFNDVNFPKPISNLVDVSDPDGDLIETFKISLEGDGGYLIFDDLTLEKNELIIDFSDLDRVSFVPAVPGSSLDILVSASDGLLESEISKASWKVSSKQESDQYISNYLQTVLIDQGTIPALEKFSNVLPTIPLYSAIPDIPILPITPTLPIVELNNFDLGEDLLLSSKADESNTDSNSSSWQNVILNSPRLIGHYDWIRNVPQLNPGATALENILSSDWYKDAVKNSYSTVFGLGVNESWSLGDYLGVSNEESLDIFIGPDIEMRNIGDTISFGGGRSCGPWPLDDVCWRWPGASITYGTGDNRFKAGINLEAGYGLGSLSMRTGVMGKVVYNPLFGISFDTLSSDPYFDLTFPYAYLDVDAELNIRFRPRLSGEIKDIPFLSDKSTGNILSPLHINENASYSLVDLDTRDMTGEGYSQSFDIGPFSASASLPRFSELLEKDFVPDNISDNPKWQEASGSEIIYGYSGDSEILDFDLSLSDLLTLVGVPPLSDDISLLWGELNIDYTVLEATIGIESVFDYDATVAYKPNVYVAVEGSNEQHDLVTGLSLSSASFSDINNDNFIDLEIVADPVVGINLYAGLDTDLSTRLKALEFGASVPFFDWEEDIGPLYDSGNISLGNLGEIEFFSVSSVVSLSDVAPDVVDLMTKNIRIPIA